MSYLHGQPNPKGSSPPGCFSGLPNFFRVNLRQEKGGEGWGYRGLGIEFAQVVCRLVPYDFDGGPSEWASLVTKELCPLLKTYVEAKSDQESTQDRILAWLQHRFPALTDHIPPERRNNFISGLTMVYLDGELL